MHAVELDNVSRLYGDVRAVDGVSIAIRDGEFFSMLGPSGSGKTTCLRLIARACTATCGRWMASASLFATASFSLCWGHLAPAKPPACA